MYRRDLVHLIDYASAKGLNVVLNPSATPRFLKVGMRTFHEAGLKAIQLGFDGASKSTHDAFRGVNGAWEWAVQAHKASAAAGVPVEVNTTITRRNIAELNAFAGLMGVLKPAAWNISLVVPAGGLGIDEMPGVAQLEDFLVQIDELASYVKYRITVREAPQHRRVAMQRWEKKGGRKPEFETLNDGNGIVFVSHAGDVCPGEFFRMPTGNIREDELIDIYRNAPLFRILRDPVWLKGKCGRCEFRSTCGGSRARAYAVAGDYRAEDPLCMYEPGVAPEPSEVVPEDGGISV